MNLSPAGEPGPACMPTSLFRCISCKVLGEQRAGADKTHIAFQDIPKFRQFVEGGCAEKAAEDCEAALIGSGSVCHASKLQKSEELAVFSGAELCEKDGRPHPDPDEKSEPGQKWGEQEQQASGEKNVAYSFNRMLRP